MELLKLRTYELPDLEILVKNIWPQSDKWRIYLGKVEFSLPKSNNEREWFPLYMSPESVEKFVKNWVRMGGLSHQERIDIN